MSRRGNSSTTRRRGASSAAERAAAITVADDLLLGGVPISGNLLAGGLGPLQAGLLGGYLGERHRSSRAAVGR